MKVMYITRLPRMLIAIFIGFCMVYVSELKDWASLHEHKGYWVGMSISILIALCLSEIVHWLTLWLDRLMPWFKKPVSRFLIQMSIGVILPLFLAVFAMFIFYDSNGYAISQTTYLDQVIIPVGLLLLVTNVYYFVHALFQDRRLIVESQLELENLERKRYEKQQSEQSAKLEVLRLARIKFKFSSNHEIAEIMMIMSIRRDLFLYTTLPAKQPWTITIKDTISLLPREDFFQISKSCIVARANIVCGYHSSSSTIELELKFPKQGFATVSQRTVPTFTLWYNQPIFPRRLGLGKSSESD